MYPVARSSDRDLVSLLWLGRAIPSSRPESPTSGRGCRYCAPALLASTSTSAVVVLTVDPETRPLDAVGKMHNSVKWLAADMVRSPRSQNVLAAAAAAGTVAASAAEAAAAPGRSIAVAGQIAASVVVAPGRSIAVAGQTAAAVAVAPGRSIAVAGQTAAAAAADAVAA